MEKIEKRINNIDCIFINVEKFNTVSGSLFFKTYANKESYIRRLLLSMILVHSCKKYPNNMLLNKNCVNNYGAYYFNNLSITGKYLINSFSFRIISQQFTNEDAFIDSLNTFREIVFNPNVNDNKFDENEFDLAYKSLYEEVKSKKENTKKYAYQKLMNSMSDEFPIVYPIEISDLKKITNESVYDEYLNMINNSEIKFIVAGKDVYNINFNFILDGIKSMKYKDEVYISPIIKQNIHDEIEKIRGYQSEFYLGIKFKDLTKYERSYVMPVFNNILGSGASSRLFNEVREKQSLCYSCYSSFRKTCDILSVYAGIDSVNYKKTYELTKKVIYSMKDIGSDEIKRAKKDINLVLKNSLDELNNYVNSEYFNTLFDEEDILSKIEIINNVTKDDLKKVYEKLYITNSFFLKAVNK